VEAYTKEKQWLPIILQNIFTDVVGFAGCELIRRTIGLAHVADLDEIANKETRIQAKKQALSLGRELIKYESKNADIQLFRALFQQTVSGGVKA
ncbi:S-methyl-5-thioribose kinase, partial [Bacillus paranthracis]